VGIDCVVTDPPYGIGESGTKNETRENLAPVRDYGNYQWDKKLDRHHIETILATGREQVIFGGNFYADWLPASSSWIVWDKDNTGDFADCELAWTSHRKAVRKFRWRWNGFLKEQPEERYHPTQKPLALMRWVVENYTPASGLVCDPFFGSGTTAVACVQTGRRFVGCEIDEGYFQIARRRIEQAMLQMRLPLGG
jgi:DNA modification methylase